LNSRSFRYILTAEGFKEKSKKTIEYIKRYYISGRSKRFVGNKPGLNTLT